jgi:hypothetical protein
MPLFFRLWMKLRLVERQLFHFALQSGEIETEIPANSTFSENPPTQLLRAAA